MSTLVIAIIIVIAIVYFNGADAREQKNIETKEFEKKISSSDRELLKKLEEGEEISPKGDILFVLKSYNKIKLVITKTMICPNPKEFVGCAPIAAKKGILNSAYKMKPTPLTETATTTKQASMGGRVVAGAVLGGGVGAAIGAASAVNKNMNGGVTKTKVYNSSAHALYVQGASSIITDIEFSKEVGYPPYYYELKDSYYEEYKGYLKIEFDTFFHRCSEEMMNEIIEFMNKKILEFSKQN